MKVIMDIDYEVILEAAKIIKRQKGKCKILPSARFILDKDGSIEFSTLVCDRLNGNSTGVGAEYCKNCIKKPD